MKGIATNVTGALTIGSIVKVDDNSGAKMLRVIGKEGYSGRRGRLPSIGVGEIFFGSIIKGKKDLKKKIVKAVLIRQRKPFRRSNGMTIQFEDNACVLVTDKNEPKASEIKGVVAKEIGEKYPKISTIAKNVI